MLAPSADARDTWQHLAATLRPFVARRVATAADVDDVLQETMLRLHRGVEALRDEERFGPWVYRVARSALADHRRARSRHPIAEHDAPDTPELVDEERTFVCGIDEHLNLLVALLPEPYRSAVHATEIEGVSQAELARREGVGASTIKSRVQRGRAKLRALIESLCVVTVDARGRLVACDPRDHGSCRVPGSGGCS